MSKNINENNQEEVKQEQAKETKKENKFGGIDINSLPDPDDNEPAEELTATTRTLKMLTPYIEEIYRSIFVNIGLTEETGLVRMDPVDETNEIVLSWDTVNLSLEEDEDLFIEETKYRASLIEALLYGRFNKGLLPGAKDIYNNKFRVLSDDNPIITQSFEIVTDLNKKDVDKMTNLIKDTLKLPPTEYGLIFVSPRPASPDINGFNAPKCSIIIINRSDEEMANLATAYSTKKFGKKANKVINKTSQTVYGTAKMIGEDIMNPLANIFGSTFGTLAGATAQSIGVAAVEGTNEFRKSFNIGKIKNSTAAQELVMAFTKGKKKSNRGGEF